MAQLNLRVGASVDRNMAVAFQPLIEGAKRAKAAIEAEGQKAGRAIGVSTKKGTKDAEAAFAKLAAEVSGKLPKALGAGSSAVVKFGKDAKTSFDQTKRAFADMAKEAEKSMAKIAAAQKGSSPQATGLGSAMRILAGRGARSVAAGAYQAAGGAPTMSGVIGGAGGLGVSLAKKAAAAAFAITKDLAKAAGVDTDIGSIAKKNFDLESAAQNVANQGLIAGDGRNSKRVRKEDLIGQALDVGEKTGTDANSLMTGLDKFTGKTGDLRTGRDIMETMAIYSKATGSSMEDMMDAAADVSNQLGNVENKGQAVKDLMRSFAGQGKLGAVEIKNLATQMSKIGAAAVRFEGTRTESITQMGVLAQMARAKGGAFSATNAATSVGAFAAVFSKGARLNAFEKMGVETQGANNKVKNPKQLLIDAMVASENHINKHTGKKSGLGKEFDKNMGSMFADVSSRKSTSGFEAIFKEAGGGAAGIARVTSEFERLERAIIADEEIMSSFEAAMKTSNSQADVFNNAIRKSAIQMQTDLMPAMAGLAKELVPLARKAAGVVQWLTGGSKQGEGMAADAKANVDETVKTIDKQVAGGKISDASIERGKEEAKQAKFAVDRAKAELETAKGTIKERDDKGNLTGKDASTYSWWNVPGRIGGSMYDAVTGAEGAKQEDITKKEQTLKDATAAYDKMTATNEAVKRKLEGKLLVVIDNVEQLKSAVTPPPPGGDGRQPAPGEGPR